MYPAPSIAVDQEKRTFSSIVFVSIFLYGFMSLNPYPDLSSETGRSLALNQLAALALVICACICAARYGVLSLVARPRTMIVLVFGWLLLTSLGAPEVLTAWRRLLVTFLVCLQASLLLTLPKSRENFDSLLTVAVTLLVALCYFGVLMLPGRAIHQAGDIVEPALAGDWRGVFEHKNIAAPAMVILFFMSLYIARSSRKLGWFLAILTLVFLIQTNGKSALGLLPVTICLAWLVERAPFLGSVVLVSFLSVFNLLTVGSAISPGIFQFVDSLGVDATFTARSDVWSLALSAVAEHPWTGYGFHSFWQVDTLQQSETATETWAVTAAHAHNAYIDTMLDGGIPALVLTFIWLVLSPMRNLSLAKRRSSDRSITRLYARIWVFALILASMESTFFVTHGLMWFALLIAVFGLHFQARADLVVTDEEQPEPLRSMIQRHR